MWYNYATNIFQEVALNKSEKIRLIYGFFLAGLSVVVGIVFIAQIATFYYDGIAEGLEFIYTAERISPFLTLPLVFLCIWIAAIIAGFVLSVVFPIKEKRLTYRDDKKVLALLKSRMPESGNEEFTHAKQEIKKLEIIRIVAWGVICAVLLTCAILIMIYVYNPSNFHSDKLREDVLIMVSNIWFLFFMSATYSIFAIAIEGIITKLETDLVKKAIASGDKNSVPQKKEKGKSIIISTIITGAVSLFAVVLLILAPLMMTWTLNAPKHIALIAIFTLILIVSGYILWKHVRKNVPEKWGKIMRLCARVAVGVVAVAFIIAGALNGGADSVLTKAIKICTECIGLG